MKTKTTRSDLRAILTLLVLCLGSVLAPAARAELPPTAQAKVDKYQNLLSEGAKDPLIAAAVKDANVSSRCRLWTTANQSGSCIRA